jgi:hypothetical protein
LSSAIRDSALQRSPKESRAGSLDLQHCERKMEAIRAGYIKRHSSPLTAKGADW